MIKVGAIRQGIHRSWNYELKMRYSLEECKQTYMEKENNRKQSEKAVGGSHKKSRGLSGDGKRVIDYTQKNGMGCMN